MSSMTYQYLLGLTTVVNIISKTCKVIWDLLCSLVLLPTIDEQEQIRIAEDFNDLWDFPHCIREIDGKHVTIQVHYIFIFSATACSVQV